MSTGIGFFVRLYLYQLARVPAICICFIFRDDVLDAVCFEIHELTGHTFRNESHMKGYSLMIF